MFLKCAGFAVEPKDLVRGLLHKVHVFHPVSNMFIYTVCADRHILLRGLWMGTIFFVLRFVCGTYLTNEAKQMPE